MIVDRIRNTQSARILVPPFHTGPIGLLPDSDVHISLVEGLVGSEVLIRPYQSNPENLMRLSCTMHDQIGVVARLVDAISELGLNIVNEVSSAINKLDHHSVRMVLDWRTSGEYSKRVPSSFTERRRYQALRSVFPISLKRYVKLYEAIMRHCGDVIVKEPMEGSELPMLSLQEISSPPNLLSYGMVPVERALNPSKEAHGNPNPYHVAITLPKPLLSKLRLNLHLSEHDTMMYTLVSDPETSTLHAFFPLPEISRKVVHLAFFHTDIPHAFEAILHPLANAGFNILTTLIRGNKENRNVLEAMLEYQGKDEIPVHSNTAESAEVLCKWATRLFVAHASPSSGELSRRCDLEIGMPLYPRPAWQGRVSVSKFMKESPLTLASSRKPAEEPGPVPTAEHPGRLPAIFLSFGPEGRAHADLLNRHLQGDYRFVVSQANSSIVEGCAQSALAWDYFIGIWVDDSTRPGSFPLRLLVELSCALTEGKRAVILHSETVDTSILNSLGPNVVGIAFSDLTFVGQTLRDVEDTCLEHFREESSAARNLEPPQERTGSSEADQSGLTQAEGNNVRVAEATTVNKAEFARKVIASHSDKGGVSAGEIFEAFSRAKLPIQRSYLYSLLQRLQEQKQIDQVGRRYLSMPQTD